MVGQGHAGMGGSNFGHLAPWQAYYMRKLGARPYYNYMYKEAKSRSLDQ